MIKLSKKEMNRLKLKQHLNQKPLSSSKAKSKTKSFCYPIVPFRLTCIAIRVLPQFLKVEERAIV
jgi:hypothetical protein